MSQQRRTHLRDLLAEAPYPVFGVDRLGGVVWTNSAAVGAFRTLGPLVGKQLRGASRARLLPFGGDNLKAWLAGRLYPIATEWPTETGGAETFLSLPFRTPSDSGAALGILVLRIRDPQPAVLGGDDAASGSGGSRPLASSAARTHEEALAALTSRERQIVIQLLDGSRTTLIAEEFRISVNTVRNHLKSIFRKLGVNSQAQLVRVLRRPR